LPNLASQRIQDAPKWDPHTNSLNREIQTKFNFKFKHLRFGPQNKILQLTR